MTDFEWAVQQSGIIPQEKIPSLLASVAKIPDFSWFITPPHPTEDRLQGDLVTQFPFAVVDEQESARCSKFTVLLVNNTCDLQAGRSRFVIVAPVFDFKAYSASIVSERGEERAKGFLQSVRANKVHELLWLPTFAAFTDGAVVLLDRLSAASVNLYEAALRDNRRLASLSQNGFYFFLIKMTNHIARAETPEVTRQYVS